MSGKKKGYDKNKKHSVQVELSGEEMDVFFENKQKRGIKTNAEYLRRLIASDNPGGNDIAIIDFQQIKDELADIEGQVTGLEKELEYQSEQSRKNASLARERLDDLQKVSKEVTSLSEAKVSLESKLEEVNNKVASLSTNRDNWMNAFTLLELAVVNAHIEELDTLNHPDLDKVRINNIRQTLVRANPLVVNKLETVVEELKSQVEQKQQQVVDGWIIIGSLEDAIIKWNMSYIQSLPETEDDGVLGISRERKDALQSSMNEVIKNKASLEKPSVGLALRLLWRSIFK